MDAHRSVRGLSVDWQAWGTSAGSAGEHPATAYGTCLPVLQIHAEEKPICGSIPDTHTNPGFPRPETRRATIWRPTATQAFRQGEDGKPLLATKFCFLLCLGAGAGENALFPSRGIFARGVLGVDVGVGDD